MQMAQVTLATLLVLVTTGASLLVDQGTPTECVLRHCGKQLIQCEINSVCRKWSSCNQACGSQDLACQIRCGDLYKPTNESAFAINAFSECVISQYHCVPQVQSKCPHPQNKDHLPKFNLQTFTENGAHGEWYITKGYNRLFDCFDCQHHRFRIEPGQAKPLMGDLSYFVKRNLNCRPPQCDYLPREVHQGFSQDPKNPAHLLNHNNSIAEMHYSDDWYILASKPKKYILVWYCGCNDAACGYGGAVLYTRAPTFDLDATETAAIKLAIQAAQIPGLSVEALCTPSNVACS